MHQSRQESTTRLPIERKGKKYLARASSNLENSIPVIIAIRDILKVAKTKKEVKGMINSKLIKINGRAVRDIHESIKLFNILEVGKSYVLKLSPTRKFYLEELKNANERLCKVIGKKLLKGGKVQINLHDGTNLIADKKIEIGDSLYLDFSGKIKRHLSPEKGSEIFVVNGKYEGHSGKIENIQEKKLLIKFKEGPALLDISNIILT
ncbi:MAG: hypothetical protein QXS38_01790 [Candidatus Pacearchaeota archaeon]